MRQHCGGTSLLTRVLESLGASKMHTVLVDMFGHDGWPAMAALEQMSGGKACKVLCANVFHSEDEYKFVKDSKGFSSPRVLSSKF